MSNARVPQNGRCPFVLSVRSCGRIYGTKGCGHLCEDLKFLTLCGALGLLSSMILKTWLRLQDGWN